MSKDITEDKLIEAKEKLACHIEPPAAHAADASSCGAQQVSSSSAEQIRLTQMTSAGG